MTVGGKDLVFKDVILTPKGASAWDWGMDGTRHNPGITIQAVQPLMNCCDVIILSLGMKMRLHVCDDTLMHLNEAGKQFLVLKTQIALDMYHTLSKNGVKVGGLFHSTC